MKRIVSMLIAVIMVLSMIPPLGVYAAEPVTVYMDPANGNNENAGTEASPVQDFAGAYALLQAGGGKIVLLSDVTYSSTVTLPACDYPVTITSKTGAEGIRTTSGIVLSGDTTFEHMTFTHLKKSSTSTIRAYGHKMTMGDGLTMVPYMDGSTAYYFCLDGGISTGDPVESTDLTIKSGQYRYIYAGSYGTNVTGNVKLTMTGGKASWVAACRTSTISGNVEMTFSGTANITSVVYGGAATSGNISGNSTITLGQGAKIANLYVGSNGAGNITGTATVIIDGYDGTFTTLAGTGGASCTGTIGATRLLLKSGTLSKTPTDFDTVDIDIPEGKTLSLACSLSADTLKSSGTLNFSGAASLTAAAVTGQVNCIVQGEVLPGHLYVSAPAGSNISFDENTGIVENNGQWTLGGLPVDEDFTGLVLMAKPEITVSLYTGREDGEKLTPDKTVTSEMNAYYYGLASGYYRYIVSGTGYYKIEKIVYVSETEAATKTVLDVTPPVRSGEGWEQSAAIQTYSDEYLESAMNSDLSQWQQHADVFTTPWFTEERTAHQMTTQDQMEAFIDKLDDTNDNLYTYSAGRSSGYDFDIPVVVITKTDLSGADTLEKAAELMGQDKATIFYRAHMHGSEPASCEAALAILQRLDGALGEEVLDTVNVVIMPRNNPDGASTYTRDLTSDIDPNGDLLKVDHSETVAYLRVLDLFQPELVMDGHEYTTDITDENVANGDAMIGLGFTLENSEEFREAYRPMDQLIHENLEANGLNYRYYTSVVNHNGAHTSRSYTSLQGTMFVLIESRGIRSGTVGYPRRIITHVVAMQTMIEYVAENAETIKSVVAAERQRIVELGSTYEDTDQVLLELGQTSDSSWSHPQSLTTQSGVTTLSTKTPKVWNTVLRSRTAPTAYVIAAGASYTDDVLEQMDKQGIAYSYIPAGAAVPLQQYSATVVDGVASDVALGDEQTVVFGKGAYVFCKNQVKGLLLSALMEPDITKSVSSSLVGQGILTEMGGKLPIYRYIHDLNAEGFIDYTVEQVQPVNITVWLDGTNGADTNNGLSEATAVKTLEQAYAIMGAAMEVAAEGSQASLKIVGLYELGTTQVEFPNASFHVTISGKTTADGFSYTGGGTQSTSNIDINGDTTFQNMTLHMNKNYKYNHLNCNGHKVVFGEGMNCTAVSANCYFTLAGGAYGSTTVDSTDLTVRSGKWRTIYAGGYTAKVTGQAKADISGCWVYQYIAPTYHGNTGSVDIKVSDTVIESTNTISAIFAGPINKNKILGDVTITLGENVAVQAVYASARNTGNINGTVTIIADGVDLSQTPVYSKYSEATGTTAMAVLQINEGSITEAMETFATGSNAYIRLGGDSSEDITLDADTFFDLNGKNLTGTVTGAGKLLGFDSANDTYDAAKCGTVAAGTNVQTVVDAPNGNRYIAVTEGDKISFHRLNVQITAVSLRTATGGLYYWADWDCDSTLADNIKNYGIACKLNSAPDAAALQDELAEVTNGAVLYSQMENSATGDEIFADANANDEITGAIMDGIISDEVIEGYTNSQRGQMPIYAEPYVILRSGEVVVAEGGVNYSLYTVCQAIDEMITGMEDAVTKADYIAYMESLFADVWKKYNLGWSFTNFSKAA